MIIILITLILTYSFYFYAGKSFIIRRKNQIEKREVEQINNSVNKRIQEKYGKNTSI